MNLTSASDEQNNAMFGADFRALYCTRTLQYSTVQYSTDVDLQYEGIPVSKGCPVTRVPEVA